MKWYEDYNRFFNVFKNSGISVDETVFLLKNEEPQKEHYIGFLPEYNKPYWAGYCDIPNGCEFKTAEELFNAKIYDGRSIKDRWNEIEIYEISGVAIEEWATVFGIEVY